MDRYTKKRKIGRGGFGQVYLIIDQYNNQYALKEISKKNMKSEERQYIDNQIKVMRALNSQYIVKIFDYFQTNTEISMILQYCNGGDLKKDMLKQPDKVYSIEQTAKILSDIIRGLQCVHLNGFLHRDVKIQNIFVKVEENQNKVYKIGDFGLSKDSQRGLTVLGTGYYMSPEIYAQQEYGFQVDMWAFGVVMYYMLHKDFPFKLSPHMSDNWELQYEQLTKQVNKYSYKICVQNSKFKYVNKCVPELEDLFSKIFTINPNQRITFHQIRSHPIFKQYFPEQMSEKSQIMYKSKFKVKTLAKGMAKNISSKSQENVQNQNVSLRQSIALNISHTQKFPKQKQLMFHLNNEIEFLYGNYKQFKDVNGLLTMVQKMPICYNLLKYYLILKRNFIQSIKTQNLCQQFPQYDLRQYFKTVSFLKQLKQFQDQNQNAFAQFQILHGQCQSSLQSINQLNQLFKQAFNQNIIQKDFVDPFKKSYRRSTLHVFNKLKKFMKQGNSGNKTNYFLALTVISHVFNRLFIQKENVTKVFKQFLEQNKASADKIDFDKLRQWMTKASPSQLNGVTKSIISKYFQKN